MSGLEASLRHTFRFVTLYSGRLISRGGTAAFI